MTNLRPASVQKAISAAQRKKDPKAGPHGSFPLDPDHLKAAWDLAGHAKDPEAVRAKVRAYARAHGMEDHLPKTAKGSQDSSGKHPQPPQVQKARSEDMRAVMAEAYHGTQPGSYERGHFLHTVHQRGLLQHLPAAAHTDLHALGLSHTHPDSAGVVPVEPGEDEEEVADAANPLLHQHVISKAFNPKVVNGLIQKSWVDETTDDQYIEGWMSTPDRDIERDITEPEAFLGGPLADYFARSAPLSLEHGTDAIPAGHLQKAVILRNGRPLEIANHPSDPAEFSHLPTAGSGVWVRGRLTDEPAKSAVRKGNVGGMSFTGNFTQYVRLPGGGKHFNQPGAINPLLESTVAAYPVNPKAAFSRVQKALGLSDKETDTTMDPETFDFDAFMQEAADRAAAKKAEEAQQQQVQKAVTPEQLGDMLTSLMAKIEGMIDSKVQKAQIPERGEGIGRKGVQTTDESLIPANQLEADPITYLVQKALKDEGHEQFVQREKDVAGALMVSYLSQGMTYGDE
jgi:hypothetical protein